MNNLFSFIREGNYTNLEVLMRTTKTLMFFGIPAEMIASTIGDEADRCIGSEHADEPCCEKMYVICECALAALMDAMIAAEN